MVSQSEGCHGDVLGLSRHTSGDPLQMAQALYLRTDEHEEAVRSLEWAAVQARLISSDPYHWKWILISMHNAVQGFIVLALWNGNGLLSSPPKVMAKWMKAYENEGAYPPDRLDSFLNLYEKVKNQNSFSTIGSGPFRAEASHDKSMERLNDFRNEFIHFTPKRWALQLTGLPRVCMDTLDIIEFFGWNSAAVLWHDEGHVARGKCALERLRQSMTALDQQYSVRSITVTPT